MAPTQIVSPVMPLIPSIPSSILSTSIETSVSDVDLNLDDFPSFLVLLRKMTQPIMVALPLCMMLRKPNLF